MHLSIGALNTSQKAECLWYSRTIFSIPIDWIEGEVLTVRIDSSVFQLSSSDPPTVGCHHIFEEAKWWQNKFFSMEIICFMTKLSNFILNLKVELAIHMLAYTFWRDLFVIGLIASHIYIDSSSTTFRIEETSGRTLTTLFWKTNRTL